MAGISNNILKMHMKSSTTPLHIDRERVTSAFRSYTSLYDPSNGKVALKIEHTYRVADLCHRIAESLELPEHDRDIAWLLGMLHDIGRFEQVKRFDSFIDAETVDHAKFGADILFGPAPGSDRLNDEEKEAGPQIEHFVDGLLTHPERALIELAIRVHNDFRIPEDLTERERIFCNILRDADKVDIFRVNNEFPMEVIYNCSSEELNLHPVAPGVMQAVEEMHCVLRSLKESPIDNIVSHICLAFELVYPLSLQITMEQGYLDRLLNLEPEHPVAKEQFAYIRAQIKRLMASQESGTNV